MCYSLAVREVYVFSGKPIEPWNELNLSRFVLVFDTAFVQ